MFYRYKEIVELLFAKGYIKLLFCTETVAIGLNLPVKTTIFTDINKHDGTKFRTLHGHEYTQAAGRAGRLGLDTVGHVIHLNNLFRNVNSVSYKQMLKGSPQTLTSKFKISYNLLLNLLDIGDENLSQFAKKSMITGEIDKEMSVLHSQMNVLQIEIEKMNNSITYNKTPTDVIQEYIKLLEDKPSSVNKKRKEIERKIQNIIDNYKTIENDKQILQKYNQKQIELQEIQKDMEQLQKYTDTKINIILDLLGSEKFVERKEEGIVLSEKGRIASHLREINCLVFANVIENRIFDDLTSTQLISIFSCFTNITVNEDLKAIVPFSEDVKIQNIMCDIQNMYHYYSKKETEYQINTGTDYSIHFDLMDYVTQWCDCVCVEDCKFFLQKIEKEKEIFLGEFVKALLKINNISTEMEKIAEITCNLPLLSKLKEISSLTLKYVVTNQSLYV